MVKTEACATPEGLSCDAPRPGVQRLRRLSHREYANTLRDLFGRDVATASFVRDPSSNGFDNDADALTVPGTLGEQYLTAAEAIAHDAMSAPTRIHACATTATPSASCITQVIETFGALVFRRPLTTADVSRYTSLHTALTTIDAASAFERLVTAMLMSPNFLYKSELGMASSEGATLDAYEVASELSYAITGSMPDAALREKARTGELLADATLEAETRRLLRTPAARETVVRFVTLWLSLDRLSSVPKDATSYPSMNDALRASMLAETESFVEHALFEGTGTLTELLSADYTFTDAPMRAHYGLAATGPTNAAGLSQTALGTTERRGVLTHASVLSVHARPNDSSPVHRGELVREHLLCQVLPPPPPGVVAMPPAFDPSLTTRERYQAHASVEPCASCHRMMDPIGFGLERFDGIGRAREGTLDTHGAIVEAGSTTGDFDDTRGLLERLANSNEVFDCFARQWFRYAYGMMENQALTCMLRDVQASFRASGGNIEDLLVALVLAPHFRVRESEAGPSPEPMVDAGVPMSDAGTPPMPDASTPPTPGLEVVVTVSDRWATGYCADVALTNEGASSVTWTVPITIESGYSLYNHWSSTAVGTNGSVVSFVGLAWNATLATGASTSFGFCVER